MQTLVATRNFSVCMMHGHGRMGYCIRVFLVFFQCSSMLALEQTLVDIYSKSLYALYICYTVLLLSHLLEISAFPIIFLHCS